MQCTSPMNSEHAAVLEDGRPDLLQAGSFKFYKVYWQTLVKWELISKEAAWDMSVLNIILMLHKYIDNIKCRQAE